jgi:hypothetical protein
MMRAILRDAEYQRLFRAALAERAKAIADAEERFRARVEAIRATRELSAANSAVLGKRARILPYGTVSLQVKKLLPTMPNEFRLADMANAIRATDPLGQGVENKAVSIALKRLVNINLELVETGTGRRGTKYRKLETETNLPMAG